MLTILLTWSVVALVLIGLGSLFLVHIGKGASLPELFLRYAAVSGDFPRFLQAVGECRCSGGLLESEQPEIDRETDNRRFLEERDRKGLRRAGHD